MRAKTIAALFFAFTPFLLIAADLVRNGTMEMDEDGNGVADGWYLDIHKGAEGRAALAEGDRPGSRCQQVIHTNDAKEWVRVSQERIAAVPGHLYALSARVRARGPWSVLLYEFAADGSYQTHRVGGGGDTPEWTRLALAVRVGPTASHFKISLVTSGPGEAWFDDVALRDVSLPPAERLPRLAAAPDIDGRTDEPAWDGAAGTGDFFLLDGDGALPAVSVQARLGVHAGVLYVAWTCAEPRMPDQRVGTPPSWNHDTVEVFLMPPGNGGYVQLGLTPLGGQLAATRALASKDRYAVDWFSTRTIGGPGEFTAKIPEWTGAVQRGESQWTAEMRIPLAAIAPAGGVWSLQLARSRKVGETEENSSWSLTPGKTFHVPAQFARIALPVALENGPAALPAPPVLPPETVRIVPLPREARLEPGHTLLPDSIQCAVRNGPAAAPAEQLAALLRDRFAVTARAGQGGDIQLGTVPEWEPEGAGTLADWQLAEAYQVDTRSLPITLSARTPQGLRHAVQTLRQLATRTPEGLAVKRALVTDWPLVQWRGWHLISPETSAALPEARRVIETLAALKMNWVALQLDNRLRYERDPDLARGPDAPTKQELSELVAFAESLGLEVIPMTQCFSHFSYFTGKEKYRHFAEVQDPAPDARHKYWNYCPRHPEVHEQLVFPLIAEQLECFPNAKYFHVGLDEITFEPIGVCPRCQGAPGGELLAEEILRLHGFLQQRGLRMGMWGDQLLVEHNGKPPYNTAEALPKVPRDVIIFDWHYGAQESFPSLGFFKQQGFEVVASGWYEPLNVSQFAWETRQNDLLGYGGTTWYGIHNIRSEIRLVAAIPLSAEFAWSPRQPRLDELDFEPAASFRQLYDAPPAPVREFLPLDLGGVANRRLADNEDRTGWLGNGPAHDLSSLPTGRQWLAGVPFDIPAAGPQCVVLSRREDPNPGLPARAWQIPVAAKVTGLAFLHTCERPETFSRHIYDRQNVNPGPVARYIVYFADGRQLEVPLRWNKEIADWNSQLGAALAETAWQGRTREGAHIRLGVFRWENPWPEVAVEAVDFVSGGDKVRPVLLAATGWR
ncbi:MAG: glycoside hydrolase family 20 zincin-like fold domain-containing protein [Lentisphaeria bacterium]|jgi:hypothetical protein|nr:glycoside hydrolase family 20 zincin-like fold domain-containing protein [Lentisphaeria bacterium]